PTETAPLPRVGRVRFLSETGAGLLVCAGGAGVQRRNAGSRLCTPDAGGTGRASAAGGRDVLWRLAALL
ncbi:hypothetical protein, partial [Salmonella enterica]|uniref:hypothetical protein n=1 Tax=Salmonella enterica TaxID=28901 RepID=UPI0023EF5248